MGDAGAFSFFPAKNLGAWGDGGAVTTHDAAVAQRIRSLRQHGLRGEAGKDDFAEPGMNSRLDALHAAVLAAKANHLETWTRERREVAARYRALLADVPGLTLPQAREGSAHVWSVFAVRARHKDALAAWLADRGVATRAYYARPVHQQAPYAPYAGKAGDLAHTEAASRELLALPMFAEITEEEQAYVAEAIRAFTQ
jgi:dTDP-4-amino-4,6-dideoxygalactose transaminase